MTSRIASLSSNTDMRALSWTPRAQTRWSCRRQSGRMLGGGRQQLRGIRRPQNIEPHRHRRAHPQRILAVVVVGAFGQRMDENVEALAVQHQPRHDFLELSGLEDDVELRNRVRASRFVAEGSRLYSEGSDDFLPQ